RGWVSMRVQDVLPQDLIPIMGKLLLHHRVVETFAVIGELFPRGRSVRPAHSKRDGLVANRANLQLTAVLRSPGVDGRLPPAGGGAAAAGPYSHHGKAPAPSPRRRNVRSHRRTVSARPKRPNRAYQTRWPCGQSR